MASEDRTKSNDLVLVPGEYAFVQDNTKGGVEVYVGPHKAPLSESDRLVTFDMETKRFVSVEGRGLEAKSRFSTAPEGWYIVLKNPAVNSEHPGVGARNTTPKLSVGQKVNLPGPESFPLWPGQMAVVRQGHSLRSNQYLLVRVYNEQAARENWRKAVVKTATTPTIGDEIKPPAESIAPPPADLTMGQLLVIKGTDVSFYIPPTGIEVVWDGTSMDDKKRPQLVREAVTLESLEYCILLDQNGNKRIERGPAVVFPEPTEIFRTRDIKDAEGHVTSKSRKIRAIELNEHSGIYIKVTAPYVDDDREYAEGEELFITGKTQKIYFPREEHAIIKYGDREVHFATAIPEGEGRYVLNRDTGKIRIVAGPTVFLPDPRQEVLVKRVLDQKTCASLYPGNTEAAGFNATLQASLAPDHDAGVAAVAVAGIAGAAVASNYSLESAVSNAGDFYGVTTHKLADTPQGRGLGGRAARGFGSDAFTRNQGYTEPRSITLDGKYRGVVTIKPYTGYAVQLVSSSGQRRVIVGPTPANLEYDEEPQLMKLSTGKPKSTDRLEETAYLCIAANKVGDIVYVETKDLVGLRVKLSYRVNFEGDPSKWFAVDNYVKFMCDHMRSKLRNEVMKHEVEHFYEHSVDILRDIILGKADTELDPSRAGTSFKENGMRIYDVEVLGLEFEATEVQKLLIDSKRNAIKDRIELDRVTRQLAHTEKIEDIKRRSADAAFETSKHNVEIQKAQLVLAIDVALRNLRNQLEEQGVAHLKAKAAHEQQAELQNIVDAKQQHTAEVLLEIEARKQAQRIADIEAEVKAIVAKAGAITPDLIAALQSFGERDMVSRVAEAMSPMTLIGGKSVTEIVGTALAGTPLAKYLLPTPSNGVAEKRSGSTTPTA